ncbi:MAG: hypothetical protein Q9227_003308 [Pyrenula ochraceoflavens]
MGRQRHLALLALGRSPYEAPELTDSGDFIHNRDAFHLLYEADGYAQQFDARGRPENPSQRRAERRLARAQNDVNATFGVVVNEEQERKLQQRHMRAGQQVEAYMEENRTDLQSLHVVSAASRSQENTNNESFTNLLPLFLWGPIPYLALSGSNARWNWRLISKPLVIQLAYRMIKRALQPKLERIFRRVITKPVLADSMSQATTKGIPGYKVEVISKFESQQPTSLRATLTDELHALFKDCWKLWTWTFRSSCAQGSEIDPRLARTLFARSQRLQFQAIEDAIDREGPLDRDRRRAIRQEAVRQAHVELGVIPTENLSNYIIDSSDEEDSTSNSSSSTRTPDPADLFPNAEDDSLQNSFAPLSTAERQHLVGRDEALVQNSPIQRRQRRSRMHEILEPDQQVVRPTLAAMTEAAAERARSRSNSLFPPQPTSPDTTPPTSPLIRASLVHYDSESVTMQVEMIQTQAQNSSNSRRSRQSTFHSAGQDIDNADQGRTWGPNTEQQRALNALENAIDRGRQINTDLENPPSVREENNNAEPAAPSHIPERLSNPISLPMARDHVNMQIDTQPTPPPQDTLQSAQNPIPPITLDSTRSLSPPNHHTNPTDLPPSPRRFSTSSSPLLPHHPHPHPHPRPRARSPSPTPLLPLPRRRPFTPRRPFISRRPHRITVLSTHPSTSLTHYLASLLTTLLLLPLESLYLRSLTQSFLATTATTEPLRGDVRGLGEWLGGRSGGWKGMCAYAAKVGLLIGVQGCVGLAVWGVGTWRAVGLGRERGWGRL